MPINPGPQGGEVCRPLKEPRTLLTNGRRCGWEGQRGWFRGLHGQESLSPKGRHRGREWGPGKRRPPHPLWSAVSSKSHAGQFPGLGLCLWN